MEKDPAAGLVAGEGSFKGRRPEPPVGGLGPPQKFIGFY